MRLKAPPHNDSTEREEREQQLREFIKAGIEALAGAPATILVIARSPESAVSRVLFAISGELARRRIGAQIIFAGGPSAEVGGAWQLSFDPSFIHEIRLHRDPRLLDGHEQLVIAARDVWFGDSMRREPDKRDAFTSFLAGAPAEAARARMTFGRIWSSARPVYVHGLRPEPAVALAAAGEPSVDPLLPGVAETLEAWLPSTRH